MKINLILFVFILFTAEICRADTVTLKNGDLVKGVILENYADRILVSTYEGEKSIMKSRIANLKYDAQEDNLLSLGEHHREKGDFDDAYFYYKKAYKVNPGLKAAKDGIILSKQAFFEKERQRHEGAVEKRRIIEEFKSKGRFDEVPEDKERVLRDVLGIALKMDGINSIVGRIEGRSVAEISGIRLGDRIIAIWSSLTGFLSKDEVISRLIDRTPRELKLTIERDIKVGKKRHIFVRSTENFIGTRFVMQWDGLTVGDVIADGPAGRAGLKTGDLVMKIEGKPTRYMNAPNMHELIRKAQGEVAFTIRREISVWKKI